jgi:hypothetical protein
MQIIQREHKFHRGADTAFISGRNWEKNFGDVLWLSGKGRVERSYIKDSSLMKC